MKYNIYLTLLTAIAFGSITAIFLFEKSCNAINDKQTVVSNVNEPAVTPAITPNPNIRMWMPSSYRGIKLGESTEEDVIGIFGKPFWKGKREEKAFANDPGNEIELAFHNVRDVNGYTGNISFTIGTIGRKDNIVKELQFDFDNPLTREEAIEQFGSDFFQIDSSTSPCIGEDIPIGPVDKKMRYPLLLVYPNKGMSLFVNSEDKVTYYYYLYKCNLGY